MGAAAQPDVVLLAPVSDDFDPSKAMPERVMVNLGKRTTGTAHPAVFSLVPTEATKDFPSVRCSKSARADWRSWASVRISMPVAAGTPRKPEPVPPASMTVPLAVPVITAASLVPLIVMVTTCAVPSTVVAVKLSVRVWPTLSACTAALVLSSV